MVLTHSTRHQGMGTAGQDLGGCRGHKAIIPCDSGSSIGNRPVGSLGTPLVSG